MSTTKKALKVINLDSEGIAEIAKKKAMEDNLVLHIENVTVSEEHADKIWEKYIKNKKEI